MKMIGIIVSAIAFGAAVALLAPEVQEMLWRNPLAR